MKIKIKRYSFWGAFVLGCIAWSAALYGWFLAAPPFEIGMRTPGMDGEPLGVSGAVLTGGDIGTIFERFDGEVEESVKGSWPRFRGGDIDNIGKENIPLADLSDGSRPDVLWTIDLGEGHAAPAVHNGRVYVLDYDERGEADILRAFSLSQGEELWRRGYNVKVRRNHGMSRTVPAVTDSAVLTVGPMCHAMAVHAVTGDLLWGIDMVARYGSETPLWYTGQCPLIDDTTAVLAPAGEKTLLVGVDIKSGEVLFETPNPRGWKMSHSSVIPMAFYGRRVYVYCASGGIVGAAAEDSGCEAEDGEGSGKCIRRGEILFESDEFDQSVVAPSPVAIGGNRIFMTAGYGAGTAVFEVRQDGGGKLSVKMIERYGVRDGLASEQQTPLYYKGHLYGVLPKDAGAHRDQFVCVGENDAKTFKWTSGPDNLFGLGPYLIADNKFYILSDDGTLTAARISDRRFEKLGSVKIANGVDAWGPMALANGRLLLRDSRKMYCVDLRKKP